MCGFVCLLCRMPSGFLCFYIDRSLLIGEEDPYPAVLVDLCLVPAVVLVRGDDLFLGGVLFYRLNGVVVDELTGLQLSTYRVVYLLLLPLGEALPKSQTFSCFTRYYRAGIQHSYELLE